MFQCIMKGFGIFRDMMKEASGGNHPSPEPFLSGLDAEGTNAKRGAVEEPMPARTKQERVTTLSDYQAGLIMGAIPAPRLRARLLAVSVSWVLLQLAAIGSDVVMLLSQPLNDIDCWSCQPNWAVLTIAVSLAYSFDILLRMYAFGSQLFFSKLWNIFDTIIVVGAGVLKASEVIALPAFRFTRGLQVLRLFLAVWRTTTASFKCFRHITGENKQRFFSAEHDFDLDLVYITPRLVAMSVPAAALPLSLYRNPLTDVAKFFELFHNDGYLICNACPEIPYPVDAFIHGRVLRFDVQDHTPPLLEDSLLFLRTAEQWMSSDVRHILIVHCKGGKGRTGSFCCAWLLYTKEAEDARDALNFFAIRRTDMLQAQMRFPHVQGVETPSQKRYVGYIGQLIQKQNAFFPSPVSAPPDVTVRLTRLVVTDMFRKSEPARQLVAAVHDVAKKTVVYWSSAAVEPFEFDLGGTVVRGDTRISFFGPEKLQKDIDIRETFQTNSATTGGHGIAGKEPGCLFYFIFHTSFLESNELRFKTQDIDKASRKPDKYKDEGSVTLTFTTR